jgi:hypothetical protein
MRPASRAQTANKDRSPSQCYRPRPYVDSRTNCLANYDEYLAIREVDKVKKHNWQQQLLEQIKSQRQPSVMSSRQHKRNESTSLDTSPYKESNSVIIDREAEKKKLKDERLREQSLQSERLRD